MEDDCALRDPEVIAELKALADKLAPQLKAFRIRTKCVFWVTLMIGAISVIGMKRAGFEGEVERAFELLVCLALLLTLIGCVIWQVRGEKAVEMRFYREEGLCCRKCGRSAGMEPVDMFDWVAARVCPHCGGEVARYCGK